IFPGSVGDIAEALHSVRFRPDEAQTTHPAYHVLSVCRDCSRRRAASGKNREAMAIEEPGNFGTGFARWCMADHLRSICRDICGNRTNGRGDARGATEPERDSVLPAVYLISSSARHCAADDDGTIRRY